MQEALMRKVLHRASLLLLVLAVIVFSFAFFPTEATQHGMSETSFRDFPLGQPRTITFSGLDDAEVASAFKSEAGRLRHRLDQLRDWTLLAAISGSRLTPREMNESTYDLPIVRREIFRRATSFEHGDTRSRVIGNSDVLALIPASSPAEQKDYLAYIADEQRKNLGDIPARLIVFEYRLIAAQNQATITRQEPIAGKSLYTDAYGYVEREMHTFEDLRDFLDAVDVLSFAQRSRGTLVLGGRKLFARSYRKIGVEEVATIWRGQQGLPDDQGCGFSLDPRLDMTKVAAAYETQIVPAMRMHLVAPKLIEHARTVLTKAPGMDWRERTKQETEFVLTLLAGCHAAPDPQLCSQVIGDVLWQHSFQTARYEGNQLAGTEVGMVLFYTDLLMKLWSFDFADSAPRRVPGFPVESDMQFSLVHKQDRERAPGARLWLGPLETGYHVSADQEIVIFARNATRVFARAHDFFSRQDKTDDPEPEVFTRLFINWWNDHYEEIARYEPEYERLNEIMKWSILITWLDLNKTSNLLQVLSDRSANAVSVVRTYHFPDWGLQRYRQGLLTFESWDKLQFDPPNKQRSATEALEIVRSKELSFFGGPTWWEGGVSLANKAAIGERAALGRGVELVVPGARRAGLDGTRSSLNIGRLKTLEATEYEFRNFSQEAVSTLTRVKPSARLRDSFGELQNVGFDRSLRRTPDGLVMRARVEEARRTGIVGDFGDLRVTHGPDGIQIGWRPRELDLGQSLARQLSTVEHPAVVLKAHPEVEVVVDLHNGQAFLVKIRGADRWVKFSPTSSEQATIAQGYHARIAGVGEKAKNIDVAWLDGEAVKTEFQANGYVRIANTKAASEGATIECCVRGPPSGGQETIMQVGKQSLQGYQDAQGDLYVLTSKLPDALKSNPATLIGQASRLSEHDLRLVHSFESGEYRAIANDLARNPAMFRTRMDHILAEELEYQRMLLQHNQLTLAKQELARMMHIHGHMPEISYRHALLEAVENPERASGTLNASYHTPLNRPQAFFDEVNHRLTMAGSTIERSNVQRVAAFAEWRHLPTQSGEVTTVARGSQLQLQCSLRQMPKGRSLGVEEAQEMLRTRDAVIYLQDAPGLNNLDPFVPMGSQDLLQLMALRQVAIYKLHLADIHHFQPAVLQDTTTGSSWILARTGLQATHSYTHYQPPQDEEEKKKRSVYIVSRVDGGLL
jgi:hypothetical protein